MTTKAPVQFAFRCTGCYQLLRAGDDEAGKLTPCPYCGKQLTVPDATADRIGLAQSTDTPPATTIAQEDPTAPAMEDWTDADVERELKRQLYVPPGEMVTLSSISSAPVKRFLGSIIDGLLVVVAMVAGFLLLLALNAVGFVNMNALRNELTAAAVLGALNVLFVVYFAVAVLCIFQWWLIATRGQSIGKFVLGMRIVTPGGRTPGFLQGVVLRNWVRVLLNMLPFFALFDAIFIFGDSHRCIHDYIANTHVVDV